MLRLGDVSREEAEVDCAEWAYRTALAKDDKLWGARYGLGLISIQTGHPQKAVDELRIACRQRPDDPLAHNALGLAFEALDSYDAAEE